MKLHHLATPALTLVFSSTLFAATPIPIWNGDPETTRAAYDFTTDSTTPAADPLTFSNPNGAPVPTTINTGPFADEWQAPADSLALHGVDDDGAWDIGQFVVDDGTGNPAGYIDVPVALGLPPGGSSYRVEFVVYAVVYEFAGLYNAPTLDMQGATVTGFTTNKEFVAAEQGLGSWQGVTWTGAVEGVISPQVTFRVAAADTGLSVVDSVEVFTRTTELIPEPSTSLLLLSFLSFGLVGFRCRS